jgi:two-component system sensor histidine kinase UhpB
MSLFWRVFATCTGVIVAAFLVRWAALDDIAWPASVLVAGAVLVAIFLLLRPLFEPLHRLAGLMRQIDLNRPGQRLDAEGKGEIALLGAAFDEMLARLEAQRQESVMLTLTAQEEERRRIARNLHDEIGQNLTAVLLQLDRLGKRVRPELQDEFMETVEFVRTSLDEVRRVARELRPGVLEDLGLANSLRELCNTFSATAGLRIERRISPVLPRLSPETELVIYRVAQESLTNALRHSEATQVDLRLDRVPGGVVLRVTDNGRGLPDGVVSSSVGGLRGMQEWALLVGGHLDVSSRKPNGVQVRLRVRAADEAEDRAA